MKFLQTSKYCPLCSTKIHETQPLLNLKLDRVMQDIVYKLVPGLQESKRGGALQGPRSLEVPGQEGLAGLGAAQKPLGGHGIGGGQSIARRGRQAVAPGLVFQLLARK